MFSAHEPEQTDDRPTHPDRASDDARQTRETQLPVTDELQKSEQEVDCQSEPDLPLHGFLVVAEEVPDLTGLLELLEECPDPPSCLVQFRYRAWRPGGS